MTVESTAGDAGARSGRRAGLVRRGTTASNVAFGAATLLAALAFLLLVIPPHS